SSIETEFAKAPDITRERLYLSTMQEILENSSKIMIDSQASNNMLYLPLDKIMKQTAQETPESVINTTGAAAAMTGSTGTTTTSSPAKPAPATTSRPNPYGTPYSAQDSLSAN